MQRHLTGVESGQHVFGRGHRQPPDVEQRTYEPKALEMGSVVARLVGARALAGVQKALTQAALDGRNADAWLPAACGRTPVERAFPVALPEQTVSLPISDGSAIHYPLLATPGGNHGTGAVPHLP